MSGSATPSNVSVGALRIFSISAIYSPFRGLLSRYLRSQKSQRFLHAVHKFETSVPRHLESKLRDRTCETPTANEHAVTAVWMFHGGRMTASQHTSGYGLHRN